ncbi:MAG: LPD28 domain-containing protein [Oscillospiraceae bacterium]
MSIDIWTDSMQHAELFGKPVLFTNWLVQRDTIPQGWHCYDLRGTRKAPNARITLVDQEVGYHAGTVLSPTPLRREGVTSRRVNGTFLSVGRGTDAGAILRGA